jgi:5-methylcytosine-specific restriction endonuclease McrA
MKEEISETEEMLKKMRKKEKREVRRANLIRILNDVRQFGCSICSSHSSLTFHHIDPQTKIWNISEMVSRNCTLTQLYHELDKCTLLCRTCHDKKHFKEEI